MKVDGPNNKSYYWSIGYVQVEEKDRKKYLLFSIFSLSHSHGASYERQLVCVVGLSVKLTKRGTNLNFFMKRKILLYLLFHLLLLLLLLVSLKLRIQVG